MHTQINRTQQGEEALEGISIHTCANYKSIIGKLQYNAYCREFRLGPYIGPAGIEGFTGIEVRIPANGTACIQISFTGIRIIVDINFLEIDEMVPTLLFPKDMVDKNSDISMAHKFPRKTTPPCLGRLSPHPAMVDKPPSLRLVYNP